MIITMVYFQVQYYMTNYNNKIVDESQTLRKNTLTLAREHNTVLNKMRDYLVLEKTRIENIEVSTKNIQERLEALETTFKQLVSEESVLLSQDITNLRARLEGISTWNKKSRAKLQRQIVNASQRNALLEKAAKSQVPS
jgi:archaellum component FlaC